MVDMLKQYGCNCLILEGFLFMSQKVNFSILDCLLFIVDARYVQGHGMRLSSCGVYETNLRTRKMLVVRKENWRLEL
jgi:hypothetical protein